MAHGYAFAVKAAPAMMVIAMLTASAAAAERIVSLRIAAGTLEQAVLAIGTQGDVTIGMTDRGLADVRLHALHGRMSTSDGLRRLLKGTDATFVEIAPGSYRIVRRQPAARAPKMAAPPPEASDAIVVTGSKRATTLADYAGGAIVVTTDALRPAEMMDGSDSLVRRLPILSSTHLGPGRDKLFIRGIADSSFTGPTQSTVGQYLGDVRLNYNAPDPDLALYDIRSIEILEGPQGTLYGAGALGGVVRLVPEVPDLTRRSGTVSASGSLASRGAAGWDAAAVVNLPIVSDAIGVRAIGYRRINGGYIDDPARGLSNINRTVTNGGRLTVRIAPVERWTVDLGGVVQDINSRDGQYADRRLPALQRASVLAQPFDNDYTLASIVLRHRGDTISLVSASSFVSHDIRSSYDASNSATLPLTYESLNRIRIFSNETRLSRNLSGNRSWVVGIELLSSTDRLSRSLGPPGIASPIGGSRNSVTEGSLFGEATFALIPRLAATVGGRLVYTNIIGEVLDRANESDDPHRHDLALLPSLGLRLALWPRLSLFARYQEGYRPGGLSVSSNGTVRFEPDSVATWELGARYAGASWPVSATVGVSYARWNDIQADIVDGAGFPFTANVGSGRIIGLEMRADWKPWPAVTLQGSLFANDSRLSRPAPGFVGDREPTLPNIPDLVARAQATYALTLCGRLTTLSASTRYVGHSRLGVGPTLDIGQGGYADVEMGLDVTFSFATLSIDASNLLDSRRNIFALGNPFGVTGGWQTTPLKPRTIRIGLTRKF